MSSGAWGFLIVVFIVASVAFFRRERIKELDAEQQRKLEQRNMDMRTAFQLKQMGLA